MATYKSIATGNFTNSSTWGLVDSTSFQNTESGAQALTTSAVASVAFTPGAVTASGILIKFHSIVTSPTGTITCQLYNSTSSVVVTSVTINASDISSDATLAGSAGWYFFKFGSNQTLLSATNYTVRMLRSTTAGGTVNIWKTATVGDWNKGLVTTTTGNPAAADILIIAGEQTGAGASNSITVTNDNTSATQFGNIYVAKNSKLTYGTSASTNYYLKLAGNFYVFLGGEFEIGTSSIPIPSTSTASLQFNCGSIGQYGMIVYGTYTSYGVSKTVRAKLASDVSVGATSIITDVSTSWKSGDLLAIAGTKLSTDSDRIILGTDATGTTVTVPALSFDHDGNSTSGVQADIINLTRNVKIFASSISFPTYISFQGTATATVYYTEHYNFGATGTNKLGLDWNSAAGSLDCQYNSFYDGNVTSAVSIKIETTSITGSVTISNNVFYNNNQVLNIVALSGTWTVDGNCAIKSGQFSLLDVGGIFTNNISANSGGNGISLNEANRTIGTFSGNKAYCCFTNGISIVNCNGLFSDFTVWRCTTSGLSLNTLSGTVNSINQLIIDTGILFGNVSNIIFANQCTGNVILKNLIINGGTSIVSSFGLNNTGGNVDGVQLINCSFGQTTAHASGDITSASHPASLHFYNCSFGSSVEFASQSSLFSRYLASGVYHSNYQGIAGAYKSYDKLGTVQSDTTIYSTASPSMRITPINATYSINHSPVKVAVKSGDTCTVSVKVRKSVVGDGTAYNGTTQPRLLVRSNFIAGITVDTVLDTATNSANGSFMTLTGTTVAVTADCVLEFYVECIGTLGWINVDDWRSAYYTDTRNGDFIFAGQPYIEMDATPKERSFTFLS